MQCTNARRAIPQGRGVHFLQARPSLARLPAANWLRSLPCPDAASLTCLLPHLSWQVSHLVPPTHAKQWSNTGCQLSTFHANTLGCLYRCPVPCVHKTTRSQRSLQFAPSTSSRSFAYPEPSHPSPEPLSGHRRPSLSRLHLVPYGSSVAKHFKSISLKQT
jgi:hypothetical protein